MPHYSNYIIYYNYNYTIIITISYSARTEAEDLAGDAPLLVEAEDEDQLRQPQRRRHQRRPAARPCISGCGACRKAPAGLPEQSCFLYRQPNALRVAYRQPNSGPSELLSCELPGSVYRQPRRRRRRRRRPATRRTADVVARTCHQGLGGTARMCHQGRGGTHVPSRRERGRHTCAAPRRERGTLLAGRASSSRPARRGGVGGARRRCTGRHKPYFPPTRTGRRWGGGQHAEARIA